MCVANDEKSCTDTEHDLHERTNKTETHAFFLTNPHPYEDWWNYRATGRMSNAVASSVKQVGVSPPPSPSQNCLKLILL
jgi:hypothetical protein